MIMSLFEDTSASYTDKAINMKFKASSLASDLEAFRTAVRQSDFAQCADRSKYLYNRLREKLDAAWPNALITAHTQFQLSLDPTLDFEDFVDAAIKIAHRLQAARLPEGSVKRINESPTPAEAANAKKSKSMTSSLTLARSYWQDLLRKSDDQIFRDLHRCTKCAWKCHANQSFIQHQQDSKQCNPALLEKRLHAIKTVLNNGDNPNRTFTDLTKKK